MSKAILIMDMPDLEWKEFIPSRWEEWKKELSKKDTVEKGKATICNI